MSSHDSVLVSENGPVVTVTMNRPEKRNALNVPLLTQLCEAIGRAEAEPHVRILILRGAGTVFCSGMDLSEASNPEQTHRSAELIEKALHRLAATRLVTIAAVQGAAVAGGAGLMAGCDLAVATADAKFGFPEVRRGLVPALILTFLTRQLRERDVRELLLVGKLIDAAHAQRIGLLTRVVAGTHALEVEVQTLVSSLSQAGPRTLGDTKQLITEFWPCRLADDFARARTVHLAGRASAEAAEGFAAFNEKRPPKWVPPTPAA